MTRINVVPVQELSRLHLVAEYREITRIPGNLEKSLNRKSKPFSFEEIPNEYTLGTGHIKFFYNKMLFLENRFSALVNEMKRRGYKPSYTDKAIFRVSDPKFHKNYTPTKDALRINRYRIKERTK